jgi:hypothetical protein
MIRVLGTRRPARIDKGVMKTLLNIVHNPLLEIRWVFAEHSEAGSGLRHDRLVTGSDGLDEIILKQANDSVRISLRDLAVGFSALSHFLARHAVRYPVPNRNMTRAEHIRTNDAHTAEVVGCPKRLPACETGHRGVTLPHGPVPGPERFTGSRRLTAAHRLDLQRTSSSAVRLTSSS